MHQRVFDVEIFGVMEYCDVLAICVSHCSILVVGFWPASEPLAGVVATSAMLRGAKMGDRETQWQLVSLVCGRWCRLGLGSFCVWRKPAGNHLNGVCGWSWQV